MIVRDSRPDDLAQLIDLMALGAVDPPDRLATSGRVELGRYEAALEEITDTPGSAVLVAEQAGRVIGMCQLIMFRHLQHGGGRCAEIESMHVRPEHRSVGIGGVLIEEAVARATAAGCYRVQLTSNKARVDAHRFYEQHGFLPTHEGYKRPIV